MITVCKFDKKKDIQETVPDLAISIEEALITGVVKSTSTSAPYTKETDVEAVGNYLNDPIDIALAAQKLGAVMAAGMNVTETEVKGE